MTQTLALLLDGYRELNAKRLFWVVLALSGLVVAAFAIVGIDKNQLTLLGWHLPFAVAGLSLITPSDFYTFLFVGLGVDLWLSWVAVGLAVVSTAGIFPDFLADGSVDLYLSKPIGRTRLFATKYVAGLLFVALQAAVFAAASYVVLGLRGRTWVPSIFLAVPAVTLVFSYLFAVSVLVGVLTRSTIAAMIVTALFWFAAWGVQAVEFGTLTARIGLERQVAGLNREIAANDRAIARADADAADPTAAPPAPGGGFHFRPSAALLRQRNDNLRRQRDEVKVGSFTTIDRLAHALVCPLPKTSATTHLLAEYACRDVKDGWVKDALGLSEDRDRPPPPPPPQTDAHPLFQAIGDLAAQQEAVYRINHRSVGWAVGTSLGFEAAVLALACWRFNRRDY